MPTPSSFDYAIIRVVPRVERAEFINAGVILFCRTQRYLAAQTQLDTERLTSLFPHADIATIQKHLTHIPHICQGAGPIGQLPLPERFHWLVAPRSTVIQTSPVHCGSCTDPTAALHHLMQTVF